MLRAAGALDVAACAPYVLRIAASAAVVRRSSFLLIGAGAGLSADSGLPVYADIAHNKAFSKEGLDYGDLCDPQFVRWALRRAVRRSRCSGAQLHMNQALFYGFWGACLNDYRSTRPHAGYDVLRRWRDAKQKAVRDGRGTASDGDDTTPRAQRGGAEATRGACWVYTSNVDMQFRAAGFPGEELYEIHGNAEHCAFGGLVRCARERRKRG